MYELFVGLVGFGIRMAIMLHILIFVLGLSESGVPMMTSKLLADSGSQDDYFGYSVAIYNGTAVVGAYGSSGGGNVYIFEQNSQNGSWIQSAKLSASDADGGDRFGTAVSISNNTIIVGASRDSDISNYQGSAYIFEQNGQNGSWIQSAKLVANDASSNDYFGWSVSISNNIAIVGSACVLDDDGSNSAGAYIFEKNEQSGSWTQSTKLLGNDGCEEEYSVSIWNGIAIVGAHVDDHNGTNPGSAYVFEKSGQNGSWIQTAKLLADDGQDYDFFGHSISIWNDIAIIGASWAQNTGSGSSGSAYIFEKNEENGTWIQSAKLLANDGSNNDYFGRSVSIWNDTAIIGAYKDDDSGSNSGSAYIFSKNEQNGSWILSAKVVPSDNGEEDFFGKSVAISNGVAIVGSHQDDDGNTDSGSAYIISTLNTVMGIDFDAPNDNEPVLDISCDIVASDEWLFTQSVSLCDSGNNSTSVDIADNFCMLMSISECDEPSASTDATKNHNYYTISIDGNVGLIGDYYDTFDDAATNVFCTNLNWVSFCIIPYYCSNNDDIFSTYQSIAKLKSYYSMTNCSFDGSNSQDMTEMDCDGSHACTKNHFVFDSEYNDLVFNCNGAYSCADSSFDSDYATIECYGFGSCGNVMTSTTNVELYGFESISSSLTITGNNSNSIFSSIEAKSSFVAMNSEIHISSSYVDINLGNESFAFYNVSIVCDSDDLTQCNIDCNNNEAIQFLAIDDSCKGICRVAPNAQCTIVNDFNELEMAIDNSTSNLISNLVLIADTFVTQYKVKAECDSNDSLTLDIGFAWYQDDDIENSDYGAICCRGYESCAYVNTMTTEFGNIFCGATLSCADIDLIQTKNSLADNEYGSIYCMAYQSCYASTMYSSNDIVCGSTFSCQNSVVMGGSTLYCVKNACIGAVIRQVETIYIFYEQSSIDIFSGSLSESHVYFYGRNSGNNIVYNCNDGAACYIDCGDEACNSATTTLNCQGKCFVTCNGVFGSKECVNIVESLAPSEAPSNAPSDSPTYAPTLSDFLTEEEVSSWFNVAMYIVVGLIVVIIIIGNVDASKFHKNDLFNWKSLLVFGFYLLDFVSDIFFSVKLYIEAFDPWTDYQSIYRILLGTSITFIVTPIIVNLVQLNREISTWMHDPILKSTNAKLWILSKTKLLYFVAIVCGSSFSAVALFNSYLFGWSLFGMGLSRYHQRKFRHKRFFSIVLMENVPQLMVQIAALILDAKQIDDYSSIVITLVSMFFTIVSITLSIFEHFLSSKFIDYESSIIMVFTIESDTIVKFRTKNFIERLVFQSRRLVRLIAQTLHLNRNQCERLIPKKVGKGVTYTFTLATEQNEVNQIRNLMQDAIDDPTNALTNEFKKIYNLPEKETISIKDLKIDTFDDLYPNARKRKSNIEKELAQHYGKQDESEK